MFLDVSWGAFRASVVVVLGFNGAVESLGGAVCLIPLEQEVVGLLCSPSPPPTHRHQIRESPNLNPEELSAWY